MTITESPPATATATSGSHTPEPTGLHALLTTGDHKTIGRLYVLSSLVFLLVVAALGVLVGFERADQGSVDLLNDTASYFQAFTLFRVGLALLVVVPLLVGLATAIVPLQVGSPSIAFPRAAAAAFWGWLIGGGIFAVSIAVDGGLGTPASPGAVDPDAVALTMISLGMVIVSLVLASICLAATVIALRPEGMTLERVPLFSWSVLVAATVWTLTLPVAIANLILAWVDYHNAEPLQFGIPAAILPGLAWLLRPPMVFAYAIPALGIVADIVPVAAKVRQKQYPVLLGAIGLFGVLSMGAFAQQRSTEEQFVYIAMGFALLLPVLMLLGGIADSLGRGRSAMGLPSAGFLLALLGVLVVFAGVAMNAVRVVVGFDLLGTSADDAVGYAVLFGALAVGLGGVAWWSVKLIGRPFPELARPLALLIAGGGFVAAVPELVSGFLDQPGGFRDTIASVDSGVEAANLVSAIGIALVALGALAFVALLVRTLASRAGANADPHDGHTLEWATASPPPLGNFAGPVEPVQSERPLLDRKESR